MIGTVLLIATMQQATLSGIVRDSVDLEPIAYAQVTVTAIAGEAAAAAGVSDRFLGRSWCRGRRGTGWFASRWPRSDTRCGRGPTRRCPRSRYGCCSVSPDRPGGSRGKRRRSRRGSDFTVPGRLRHRFRAAQDPAHDPGDGRAAGDRGLPLRLRALRLHLGAFHSWRHQRRHPGAARWRPGSVRQASTCEADSRGSTPRWSSARRSSRPRACDGMAIGSLSGEGRYRHP